MSVEGDKRITASRDEVKYLVSAGAVAPLRDLLDRNLPLHHHAGEQSELAAFARHYTTTVYFDTPSRSLLAAAQSGQPHIKMRAREYYDVLPLDEIATEAAELMGSASIIFLELKMRDGEFSAKRRVGVPKRRLTSFLRAPKVDPELESIQRASLGEEGARVLKDMLSFLSEVGEPLEPSCIVNYARSAWQSADGSLRVTLDEDLAFYKPSLAMWQRDVVLARAELPPPVATESSAVLEVKSLGEVPRWLGLEVTAPGYQKTGISKFVRGSEAVVLAEGSARA